MPASRASAASETPGLSELIAVTLRHGRQLAADYALLAVLDARSAAVRFALLVGVALVACVLLVTAWLAVVVAATVWLVGTGTSWAGALTIAAALNVVAAVVLILWLRGPVLEPPFAATLRQLRGEPPQIREGER